LQEAKTPRDRYTIYGDEQTLKEAEVKEKNGKA